MADIWDVECDVMPGLEPFLAQELRRRFGGRLTGLADSGRASLRFGYQGDLAELLTLRTAQAVFLAWSFAGRRPSLLLGHQALRTLAAAIATVRDLHPADTFGAFRFAAAGRDSTTFRRLADEIRSLSGLRHEPETGDLVVRVRPSAERGWEVLVRLSSRPLATRPWRVRNLPGALNATIAAAMVELTDPRPEDRFCNLLCGSGTLLAERLLRCPAAEAVGCDVGRESLAAARANLAAAGVAGGLRLLRADATATGLADSAFTALCADLPYGNLVGSHRSNAALYPGVLREAARLAAPGAAFAVITHELRLFDACLREAGRWTAERTVRVLQGGQRPQLYLLRRRT